MTAIRNQRNDKPGKKLTAHTTLVFQQTEADLSRAARSIWTWSARALTGEGSVLDDKPQAQPPKLTRKQRRNGRLIRSV